MPIIQVQSNTTPLQKQINTILNLNTQLLNVNKNAFTQIFKTIWYTNGVSAQQIFNVIGTDSVKLFESAALLTELIQLVDPTFTPPATPYPYTVNVDGTVTVDYSAPTDTTPVEPITPTP